MRVPCIQSVWFAREKGKEKNHHDLLQILSSLFPSNLEGKENVGPMENSAFSFPLFNFSKQIKIFLFLPLPSLAFPPATLQPNIYIYIYIEHFLPIVFINHCIEYGVVQELTKPFIYLFMYFLERWKWNT